MGCCCCKKKVNKTEAQKGDPTPPLSESSESIQGAEGAEDAEEVDEEQQVSMSESPRKISPPKRHELTSQNESTIGQEHQITVNRPTQVSTQKKQSFFFSHKFLPINIRKEYKHRFRGLSAPPDGISDQEKEIFMTLNIARTQPKFFANNVLESIRDRIHSDKFYNSYSNGMVMTEEGVEAMDSLLDKLSKAPVDIKGLRWNNQLIALINETDISNIDVIDANIFDIQEQEEQKLKDLIDQQQGVQYQDLKVLIDYNTDFGFEIVTNLLIDDGNEEKDVRETLLSSNTESIAMVHTRHNTYNMITYIVLAGKEIFYNDRVKQKLPYSPSSSHSNESRGQQQQFIMRSKRDQVTGPSSNKIDDTADMSLVVQSFRRDYVEPLNQYQSAFIPEQKRHRFSQPEIYISNAQDERKTVDYDELKSLNSNFTLKDSQVNPILRSHYQKFNYLSVKPSHQSLQKQNVNRKEIESSVEELMSYRVKPKTKYRYDQRGPKGQLD